MIFYFTGTGNSYQAALALRQPGEALLDLAACLREGKSRFALGAGESLGFVCPVYYGGLPSAAAEFIRSLSLEGSPAYCYGVLTCGGSPAGAAGMLQGLLRGRGVALDAAYTVAMPDNYAVFFSIPEEGEQAAILERAGKSLEEIRERVLRRERRGLPVDWKAWLMTQAMYPLYARMRSTKRFYTDEQCIGCGACVRRCPAGAMTMENGRPRWVKEQCIHCMSCIRCGAVQYGKRTVGKKRYTNPVLKGCRPPE